MALTAYLQIYPTSVDDPHLMQLLGYTATESAFYDYSQTEDYYVLAKPPEIAVNTLFRVGLQYAFEWFGFNANNGLKIISFPFYPNNFKPGPPVIVSGTIAADGTVTIVGEHFAAVTSVVFDGAVPASSFVIINDTTITAIP